MAWDVLHVMATKLNQDRVPSTFDEAVTDLLQAMDANDSECIASLSDTSQLHFGLGGLLRYEWSLWQTDTPLVQDFRTRFRLFGHADDISHIILCAAWAQLRGVDVPSVLDSVVIRLASHWEATGTDPVTGISVQNS